MNADRVFLATNSPQAQSYSNVHSRISAGFSRGDFGSKNGPERPFLSIVFRQLIDLKVVGATGFEPATSCSRSNENSRQFSWLIRNRHRLATRISRHAGKSLGSVGVGSPRCLAAIVRDGRDVVIAFLCARDDLTKLLYPGRGPGVTER